MYCCSLWCYYDNNNDHENADGGEELTIKTDGGLGGLLQASRGHSGLPGPRGSLSPERWFSVQLWSRV